MPAGNIGLELLYFPELFHDIRGNRNFGFGVSCFEQLEERCESFCMSGYVISVIIQKANISLKCFFGSWKFDFFEEFGNLLFLRGNPVGCYCSSKEIYFLYSKMAFGHAEFETSFLKTLENCL